MFKRNKKTTFLKDGEKLGQNTKIFAKDTIQLAKENKKHNKNINKGFFIFNILTILTTYYVLSLPSNTSTDRLLFVSILLCLFFIYLINSIHVLNTSNLFSNNYIKSIKSIGFDKILLSILLYTLLVLIYLIVSFISMNLLLIANNLGLSDNIRIIFLTIPSLIIIYLSLCFSQIPFIVVHEEISSPFKILKQSFNIMKGNKIKYIQFSFGLIHLVLFNLISFGICSFFTTYKILFSLDYFYITYKKDF